MVDDGVNWRRMTRRAALILAAAVVPFALSGNSAVHAQSIMRTPSLHIDSRIPTINPTVAPRINPTIAGRGSVGVNSVAIARTPPPRVGISAMRIDRPVGVGSSTPYVRYSHNLYPVCGYANRGPDGECFDRPLKLVGSGGSSGAERGAGDRFHRVRRAASNAFLRHVGFLAELCPMGTMLHRKGARVALSVAAQGLNPNPARRPRSVVRTTPHARSVRTAHKDR